MKGAKKMAIEYTQNGDYLIPNLKAPEISEETEEALMHLGKFGLERERFLEEHKRGRYLDYLTSGTLAEHLIEIDRQAYERKELMMQQMKKARGVNLEMQEKNWWGYYQEVRTIEAEVESTIMEEMIFV